MAQYNVNRLDICVHTVSKLYNVHIEFHSIQVAFLILVVTKQSSWKFISLFPNSFSFLRRKKIVHKCSGAQIPSSISWEEILNLDLNITTQKSKAKHSTSHHDTIRIHSLWNILNMNGCLFMCSICHEFLCSRNGFQKKNKHLNTQMLIKNMSFFPHSIYYVFRNFV